MNNIWRKIYGLVNGALRFGPQGPTIQNNTGVLEVRDNAGTGAATLDVDKTTGREVDVVATDGKKTLITMQTGATPATIPVNLPNSAGNSGDTMKTDGAGNWYWEAENQEGTYDYPFTYASAATINLNAMPNNFQISKIVIDVTTPFTGGAGSSITVGIAGETAKFVAAADTALGLQATFVLDVEQLQAIAAQMIATFTVGGSTAGAGRIIVSGSVPK